MRDLVDAIEAAKEDVASRHSCWTWVRCPAAESRSSKRSPRPCAIRIGGKKVIALGESYDQAQYYLAANADEMYLDPQGIVLIEGYGYYRTFLKGAIDKLAVDVNIFRAGKFKSYTDQFTRSDMSEEDREESLAWLNALWAQYQAGVTQARGLERGRDRRLRRTNSPLPCAAPQGRSRGRRARARSGDRTQIAARSRRANESARRRERG